VRQLNPALIVFLFSFISAFLAQCIRPDVAQADSDPDQTIVSVDGVLITRSDLENAVNDRIKKSFEFGDDHLIRTTLLKRLITELVAEKLMTDKEIAKTPFVARALETTRRDILLKSYIDKQTVLPQPSGEDIKKYISDHPQYFQDRKMYHYSELIIDAKTEAVRHAVSDRVKLLSELKEPSPDNLQMVISWLEQNNIVYGYAKDWKTTETLPPALQKTILALSKDATKVAIETKGMTFRVVALYGAFPDPINPLFASNAVARALLDEARTKRVDAIVDNMLAHSKIVLYDPSFRDLKVPKFKGAAVQPSVPWGRRIFISWNFALLILAPLSLYVFLRGGPPELREYETRTIFEAISYTLLFRIAVIIVSAVVLLAPTVSALAAEYEQIGKESYLSFAFSGVVFGLVAAFGLSRIKFFKNLLSSRWLGLSILVLIQTSLALTLE
jgi:EpsD family peptidyl-prolyl cis-trans isomerase